ncbi:DUF2218 domain-containing protein [Acinetobacter sp. ANC 4648]|uniref:DUF2218 domain-containing protein n=1 Tax=Acinetobacter sp. ANC 4648 TaxID=1977875 RepID=UPI000A35308F|nr:DUF2218 domain-containing protein [Acinetobacter sp. ANC 4648]OTG79810.1 hypothetical protein B9T27_14115 [Acinetobacter sp. ANC 4648]
MKSHTSIPTLEAKRIAKRLLNHWKHKFKVTETETIFSIFMPETTIVLTAETDRLIVDLNTQLEDYTHIEQVVLDHLNRMAQQEFSVAWQHQT